MGCSFVNQPNPIYLFLPAHVQYTQAVSLKVFIEEERLVRSSELPLVEAEEFLAGVLGFTEELSRHAVQHATLRHSQDVKRCRDMVDAILAQFLRVGGWVGGRLIE